LSKPIAEHRKQQAEREKNLAAEREKNWAAEQAKLVAKQQKKKSKYYPNQQ
jgi:hypothetical protein